MATINVFSTFAAGASNSGQGTNVGYAVIDTAGTTRIARATAATEDTDAAGATNTGVYRVVLAIDPTWLPCRVKWDITGKAGVAGEDIIGNESAFQSSLAVASVTAAVALSVTPPTAIQVRAEMDANSTKLAHLDADVSTRSTYAGGAVASVTAGVSVADKTGFSLANGSISSATFTVAAITGPATGILEKLDQLWRRFFRKATKTSSQIKTYADDGTTVLTTQAVSDDSTTQTQGAAS